MDNHITRLTLNDYDECLDFLNLVFSQSGTPIDFEKKLPKAFRRREELMNCHWAIRRNGRIRAVVGVYPMDLQVLGEKIHCATVGNIAVHLSERGKGLMKLLMCKALDELKQKRIDLSRLGGYRQRYNRYGYEIAGSYYDYILTSRNLKDFFGGYPDPYITFCPISKLDTEFLEMAFYLYHKNNASLDRINLKEFYCYLRAHYMQPWAAVDKDGKMIGYLVASETGERINEQFAISTSSLVGMLSAWMHKRNLEKINFRIMPWDNSSSRALGKFCENFQIKSPCMFYVMNWIKAVRIFLTLKISYTDLPEGNLIIGIKDYGNININISSGRVKCELTNQVAQIKLDRLTATRLIFGPMPPTATIDVPREASLLVNAWFPLPLSWYLQDNV